MNRKPRAFNTRSVRAGEIGALAMAVFYVAVVAGASGSWAHLRDQARTDWAYLLFIIAGFAVQVALLTELRRRHRLNRATASASGAGAGASTIGMVACCAHHLADLLPVLGATGAATFLTDQQTPVMVVGITITAAGVTIAARRLRKLLRLERSRPEERAIDACAIN